MAESYSSKNTPHEAEIGERKLRFYPISARAFFSLNKLVGPVTQAVSALFFPIGESRGWKEQEFSGQTEGKVLDVAPSDPKVVEQQMAQRRRAIEDLTVAWGDEGNQRVLASILMDSLRDDEPRKPTKEQINDFIDRVDFPALVMMLKAVAEANKEAFGPLAGRLRGLAEKVGSQIEHQIQKPRESVVGSS